MKALVVDDDRVLADVIAYAFKREGYEVILAEDGEAALLRWSQDNPDLVILDVNMPKMDGFSVCRHIREQADTAIIMLTVRRDEADIMRGFTLGADDYITKPFSPGQLMARARAVLRRTSQDLSVSFRQVGNTHLNLNRRELVVDGGPPIVLTALEHRLVDCLMINAGQVVTRDTIMDYVWGSLQVNRDMVRQLVCRLRSKIEPDPANPMFIENVPGLGYAWSEKQSTAQPYAE
jgi:DNA-binding response OmpR family regulator